jgi:hypothetical protein
VTAEIPTSRFAAKATAGGAGWEVLGSNNRHGDGGLFAIGWEYRFANRHLALRGDLELSAQSWALDPVALKASLLPDWALRPFASAGFTLADPFGIAPSLRFGLVLAAGLDLHLGRHVFLEIEAKGRVTNGMTQFGGALGAGYLF